MCDNKFAACANERITSAISDPVLLSHNCTKLFLNDLASTSLSAGSGFPLSKCRIPSPCRPGMSKFRNRSLF